MKFSASSSITITAVAMVLLASAPKAYAQSKRRDNGGGKNEKMQKSLRHLKGSSSMDGGKADKSVDIKYITVTDEETILPETIRCGSAITGSTKGKASGSFPECGFPNNNSPAVYFKLEGASGYTDINLCTSSYDTRVSVFREVCDGNFECVGGDDAGCGCGRSLYTIPDANPDDVYYVIVHGHVTSFSGTYRLAIYCDNKDAPPVYCGTDKDALPDTMDASSEMVQTMKEKEEMMPEMRTEGCEESERVCPASAGK